MILHVISEDIFTSILSEWIEDDILFLDNAICNRELRCKYLYCIQQSSCKYSINIESSKMWTLFYDWQKKRSIRIENLHLELSVQDDIMRIFRECIFGHRLYQNLKSLLLRCASLPRRLEGSITTQQINGWEILANLPSLEKIDFDVPVPFSQFQQLRDTNNLPTLKIKDIIIYGPHISFGNDMNIMRVLQECCPHLLRLGFQLPLPYFLPMIQLFSHAKSLRLWQQQGHVTGTPTDLQIVHSEVEELFLGISNQMLTSFTLHCPRLTTLYLRIPRLSSLQLLSHNLTQGNWKLLQHLTLQDCTWCTDDVLQSILIHCETLCILELIDCSMLTSIGFQYLAICKSLHTIKIVFEKRSSKQVNSSVIQALLWSVLPPIMTTISSTWSAASWAPITMSENNSNNIDIAPNEEEDHSGTTGLVVDDNPTFFPNNSFSSSLKSLHLENCLFLKASDYTSLLLDSTIHTWEDIAIIISFHKYLIEDVDDLLKHHKLFLSIMDTLSFAVTVDTIPKSLKGLKSLKLKLPLCREIADRLYLHTSWNIIAFPILRSLQLQGIYLPQGNLEMILQQCPMLIDLRYSI